MLVIHFLYLVGITLLNDKRSHYVYVAYLAGRLDHIRDHVYHVMVIGVVEQRSEEWLHLEAILEEVHGGRVYRRRCEVQGSRG